MDIDQPFRVTFYNRLGRYIAVISFWEAGWPGLGIWKKGP